MIFHIQLIEATLIRDWNTWRCIIDASPELRHLKEAEDYIEGVIGLCFQLSD